jgi:hypothetical protein
MRKIKAGRRIKKTGGDDIDIIAPYLPESLYKLAYSQPEKQRLEKLKNLYDVNYTKIQDKINSLKKDEKILQTAYDNEELRNIKLAELDERKKNNAKNFYLKLSGYVAKFIYTIGISFFNILGYIIARSSYLIVEFFKLGQGIIPKSIIFILFILLIFGIGVALFMSNRTNGDIIRSSDISKKIITNDTENYLSLSNPFSFMTKITNGLNDIIPNDFKYKYTSLTNSLNYITTGKNQYQDYLEPRKTLETGRSDNIFHMNFDISGSEYSKEKTYCTLKPKPIVFNFNSNLYQSSDYNRLNENLRNDIQYPNKYTIDITSTSSSSGRYVLNVENSKYYINNTAIEDTTIKLPKLFKINKNEVLLNNYNSISFNENVGLIGLYGVKLLNKNYRDNILVITAFNKDRQNNEYRKIYYINNKLIYYNSKNEEQELKFTDYPYYNVEMLLDQSGNNRHFIFKQNDNKYRPVLIVDEYGNYAIRFQSRSILYQNVPIKFPKMTIKSTIKVNKTKDNNHYNKLEGYIDFLGSYTSSVIKLLIPNKTSSSTPPDKYTVVPYNDIPYYGNNEELTKTEFYTDRVDTIVIDLNTTDRGIETIGCVHDPRTDIQKAGDYKQETHLNNMIAKNNFVGDLYDLYIYDRTKIN